VRDSFSGPSNDFFIRVPPTRDIRIECRYLGVHAGEPYGVTENTVPHPPYCLQTMLVVFPWPTQFRGYESNTDGMLDPGDLIYWAMEPPKSSRQKETCKGHVT
jgi:hypothetical protein